MRSPLRVIRSLPTRLPPDSMTLVVLSGISPQICFLVHAVKALRHAGSSKAPGSRPYALVAVRTTAARKPVSSRVAARIRYAGSASPRRLVIGF
jgi:hypothetical protein